jgi:cell division protein FtsB
VKSLAIRVLAGTLRPFWWWGERLRGLLVVPALVAVAIVYATFDHVSGIRPSLRLRADLQSAETRIEALRLENAGLRRETELLEADPFALERAIREDLKLARPGDTIVRLVRAPGSNPRIP